jgi:hypothetical protein
MKSEVSILYSEDTATGLYPEADESNADPPTLFT